MKKGVLKLLSLFFVTIVLISGVIGAENDSVVDDVVSDDVAIGSDLEVTQVDLSGSDASYACLENQISGKSLSLQEAIFTTLAIGARDEVLTVIASEKDSTEECWPKGKCDLRTTSLVALAYDRVRKNTEGIESWLLSKGEITSELNWYLQADIENDVESTCALTYDGQGRNVVISEEQIITGNPGACFSITNQGYWMQINKECLSKSFSISCDQDFITTILYQKANGPLFVSSNVHGAASLGTTEESVSAECFKSGTGCSYEGSLWAAYALQSTGNDVSKFIPYLLSVQDSNKRYFPSALLYLIIGGDGHYTEIVEGQKQGEYWQIVGSQYNRFFDTALANLALSGTGSIEHDSSKVYLEGIKTADSCWNNNNIRDTAFILYSAWPKTTVPIAGDAGRESCSSAGNYCEQSDDCTNEGGDVLYDYDCSSAGFGKVCCSVSVPELSCSEKDGVICESGESCTESTVSSSDGSCCKGSCEVTDDENDCEFYGGDCRYSCDSGEKENSDSCGEDSSKVCCVEGEESGGFLGWIIFLIILIGLVTAGIIYRDKLRVWFYQIKGKFKSTPVVKPQGAPSTAYPGYRGAAPGTPPPQQQPVRGTTPQEGRLSGALSKLRGFK